MATESQTSGVKPLVVAVAVALVGMVFMRRSIEAGRKPPEIDKVAVLTVRQAVEAGDALQGDSFDYRLVARDDQPGTSIQFDDPASSPDARRRYEDIQAMLDGRLVRRTLGRNEIVQWFDLDEPVEERLSALFEGKLRGLAVMVDRTSLLGGLLQPNDRVDVLATFPAGITIHGVQTERHEKTMVILEDVTVLAVGGRMTEGGAIRGGGGGTVVLALDPDQSLLMSHVQKNADISLLLRPLRSEHAGTFERDKAVSSPDVQQTVLELMERSDGR